MSKSVLDKVEYLILLIAEFSARCKEAGQSGAPEGGRDPFGTGTSKGDDRKGEGEEGF